MKQDEFGLKKRSQTRTPKHRSYLKCMIIALPTEHESRAKPFISESDMSPVKEQGTLLSIHDIEEDAYVKKMDN